MGRLSLILLFLAQVALGAVLLGESSEYPSAVDNDPVWTCTPNPFFEEGIATGYDLCVHDPEGEEVTVTNQAGCTLPTGISIDNTPTLPNPSQIDASSSTADGTTTGCVFRGSDGTNTADSDPFTITIVPPPGELVAFPGAYGFGKNSTGGRGGEVVYVTSLSNTGAGTLRNALTVGRTATPRNVLFAICGRITLSSDMDLRNNANLGNVYIAGQTAPCPVVITGGDFRAGSPNITMRYLTLLHGAGGTDGTALHMGFDPNAHHIIGDHLTIGWHEDEVFNMTGGDNGLSAKIPCANHYGPGIDCPGDMTLQNSLIAEGFSGSGADVGKGWLNYGVTRVSGIRNLYVSAYRRAPINYDGITEQINNVIYNYWGGGEAPMLISGFWDVGCHSIIGNIFKDGPGTQGSSVMDVNSGGTAFNSVSSVFLQGNRHRIKRATDGLSQTAIINNLRGMTSTANPPCAGQIAKTDPMIMDAFVGDASYNWVIAHAGNQHSAWTEDAVTSRLLTEAASGTAVLGTQGKYSCSNNYNSNSNCDGSFINISGTPTGGFPSFSTTSYTPATVDTDLDGITNACEDANGLNKNSAADGPLITGTGYSNLDNFLNYKAGDVVGGYNSC